MPQKKDHFAIIKKITPKRFFNAVKLFLSYQISKLTKSAYHRGLPLSIAIEPTTACNLRCPECPSGLRSFTRPTGMLQNKTFEKIIDELHQSLIYLIFYFQGEPYLNPSFLEMVSYASKKNIYTATSTNAHYLTDDVCRKTIESGLNRLIISIDGTTQETYEAYRIGGKLEKVIEGAKNMVKWKKEMKSSTPHLIFQFLVVKPNEHQLDALMELANQLEIDEVRFKTAQVYDYKNGNSLIPENYEYSRYKKNKDGTYSIKNQLLNHCWKMWHSCVITWDGKIVPCCFDKDATHTLGDLASNSFNTVWKSMPYHKFRNAVIKGRSEIDICKNCTEGTKVFA